MSEIEWVVIYEEKRRDSLDIYTKFGNYVYEQLVFHLCRGSDKLILTQLAELFQWNIFPTLFN